MSHELHPVADHPELYLDASLVDGSHFIRTRAEVEATFRAGWELHLEPSVSLRTAEELMFRSHFALVSGRLTCTQCGARFRRSTRRFPLRPTGALRHMRANSYGACPEHTGRREGQRGSPALEPS